MSKSAKKAAEQAEREKVQKRYSNRREPDVIYPARKQVDFYDADVHQRVAVYVRVSTDNTGSSIASGEAATPIPGTHRPEVPVQEEIKNG